ncbi:MAG: FAD-dependent oxidoreductase [Steroidobacteraceae bacterium]
MQASAACLSSENARSLDADVLIVGAGPTGLTAAVALALKGIRVTVIDAQPEGSNTSRAAVIHARTLETLEATGVSDRLVKRGLHAKQFTIRDRDRVLVPVRFDKLPTRYPYTLMISQAETEEALRRRLAELGGVVHWGRALEAIVQDANGVTATLVDGTIVSARYAIGADGMHSKVRACAGIDFPGDNYEQSFSLADVRLSGGVPTDEVILFFSPAGLVVVAPLPDGVHRIVATVDDSPEHPDLAFVQSLLDARGPEKERAVVHEVLWGSRFRVQHRVAATYRSGRLLLAGDAAHVHSPAGGQGMNTGIQDAIALADALTAAMASNNDAPLSAYAAQRRPIALQVVGMADGLTRLATLPRAIRPLRNIFMRGLAKLPVFRRRLSWRLSGLVFRQ